MSEAGYIAAPFTVKSWIRRHELMAARLGFVPDVDIKDNALDIFFLKGDHPRLTLGEMMALIKSIVGRQQPLLEPLFRVMEDRLGRNLGRLSSREWRLIGDLRNRANHAETVPITFGEAKELFQSSRSFLNHVLNYSRNQR
jgi:hypothetical protein